MLSNSLHTFFECALILYIVQKENVMLHSIFIICIGLLTLNLMFSQYIPKLKDNETRNAVILLSVAFSCLFLDYHIVNGTFDNLKMPENTNLAQILLERVNDKLDQM